ncbi:helix-turn-helix domain-containing protein [Vibrio parahaemolyticus]|uniref:helix-turn-helix domain-containing protein n=1 Tax=Vibrio parahaemolyticus TaxID=670 RepID=UPI0013761815|nr:helix-turn-helix domain-containing protein [Vibrio parahaemolyticus]MCF9126220.1 helix-turn-helix domain-containing protein [Vibrio parahaemolyticus]NCM80904.1 helix-turn-helix domain-containing protein [Vibrio parahaemolyticus]
MKYLTIDEVCEMLSISRRTLERMRSPDSKILFGAAARNALIAKAISTRATSSIDILENDSRDKLYFPEPDLYIGKSPRWEMNALVSWLSENGHRL